MTLFKWSQTASSNATADSTINWAEGMAPSAVNDSGRAMMAAAAKYRDDISGTKISTGGSANAYTVSTNQSLTSLTDGFRVAFILSATNTGASTINVDSLGTKPLRTLSGTALVSGEIVAGCVYTAAYDSGNDEWLIDGGNITSRLAALVPAGIVVPYAGSSAPTGYLLCYGQAVSRTTYATLFSAIGTSYGAGDGSSTFNLPDIRGRTVAGRDDMGGSAAGRLDSATTLGSAQGSKSKQLAENELPEHRHLQNERTHSFTYNTESFDEVGGAPDKTMVKDIQGSGGGNNVNTNAGSNNYTEVNSTSNDAFSIVQPTIILNYIIKT